MVVINFIYSVLVLIFGSVVAMAILIFGVKFCNDSKELGTDPTWQDIFLQMMRGYPFWVWIFAFLVFQPAIIHIVNAWYPAFYENYAWIPGLSDFMAFIAVISYIIVVKSTDDDGNLIKLFGKSE
jgi:hypothetical protein